MTQMKIEIEWRLLAEGEPLKPGDGFWHPDYARWIDYDCRPDLFRGDREYVHTWPWRRKIQEHERTK